MLCISDIKALVGTGKVSPKHSAPSDNQKVSLHRVLQCLWMCSSHRTDSQVCRPAPYRFHTRWDFHMTKADQGQKSTSLFICMPLKIDLSERKKSLQI